MRSASKNHGAKQMIEGQVKPTDLIVVIDDVLTTGQSAYRAVKIAQRHTSAQVQGVVAIFSYETKFQTVYANRYQTPCRAVLTLSDLKLFLQTYHHLQVTAYQQVVEALSDHFEVPP